MVRVDVLTLENAKREQPELYPMRGGQDLDAYWAFWTEERIERWRAGRMSLRG